MCWRDDHAVADFARPYLDRHRTALKGLAVPLAQPADTAMTSYRNNVDHFLKLPSTAQTLFPLVLKVLARRNFDRWPLATSGAPPSGPLR